MGQDFLNSPDEGDETYTAEGEGQAQEMEFGYVELPAEGKYEVVCMGAAFTRSKSSGAPQIILNLANPEVPGAASKYYMTNTPGGKWRFDADLKTFGLEPPTKEKPVKLTADDFVGKKVTAKGVHDRYQGRLNFKFTEIEPTAEGPGARAFGAAA